MQRWIIIGLCLFCLCTTVHAQDDFALGHVIENIYSSVIEAGGTVDFEELQEHLLQLSEQKININQATSEDLRQLFFLDEEKIENILLYRDLHPLHSVYEVQLIPGLREWEYRFLAHFVEAGEVEKQKVYVSDLFRLGQHDVTSRLDCRNLESFSGDPVYISLKYKFQSMNKLSFGITAERDANEPWWSPKTVGFDYYGGFFQLNDVWKFKTIVVGDYRANFGLGLVVNGNIRLGKTSFISNLNVGGQGLKKYSSTNENKFYRGIGTTLRLGPVDATIWYSYKYLDGNVKNGSFPSIITTGYHRTPAEISHKRTVREQVIGANVTYRWDRLCVGLTMQESLLGDTLHPKATYYNEKYFVGKNQATLGAYAFWHYDRWQVFGEVATAQNRQWGVGALVGTKVEVVQDVRLLALGRYYSPWFDNRYAEAFGESTKNNDELGLFVGAEILRLKDWRLAFYADVFHFSGPKYGIKQPIVGCELQGEAQWKTCKGVEMSIKSRWKRKDGAYLDRLNGRYMLLQQYDGWRLETAFEGSLCTYKEAQQPTLGYVVRQDVAYSFKQVPIVIQTRLEWFDAKHWNNRLYIYENDVLYAFSIPSVYGQGGRWYVNTRWKIDEHYSLYFKAAETIYTKKWASSAGLKHLTHTDFHLLLRIKY